MHLSHLLLWTASLATGFFQRLEAESHHSACSITRAVNFSLRYADGLAKWDYFSLPHRCPHLHPYPLIQHLPPIRCLPISQNLLYWLSESAQLVEELIEAIIAHGMVP